MNAAVRVLSYLKRYWFLEILVILCLLGVTASTIVVPLLVRVIIDDVIVRMDYSLLLTSLWRFLA